MAHNKQKNVGLTYDIMVRSIATMVIEGDETTAGELVDVIKRRYRPGTAIHAEFRLFEALAHERVSSDAVAVRVVTEAQKASRTVDAKKLDREKQALVDDIRRVLGEHRAKFFYDVPIPAEEYRTYATIQQLINGWRGVSQIPMDKQVEHERRLIERLTGPKSDPRGRLIESGHDGPTLRLAVKMMVDKVNERYGSKLNKEQQDIVRAYAFSKAHQDTGALVKRLRETAGETVRSIDEAKRSTDDNMTPSVVESLDEARAVAVGEDYAKIDDRTVMRHLAYVSLRNEIASPR